MEDRWDYLDRYKDRPFRRPSKTELFREYLARLTHPGWFRDTLVERPNRDAFDQLVKVWQQEETAITESSDVLVLDAMNLLAAVHIAYELSKRERFVTDLEKRLDRYERTSRCNETDGERLREAVAGRPLDVRGGTTATVPNLEQRQGS